MKWSILVLLVGCIVLLHFTLNRREESEKAQEALGRAAPKMIRAGCLLTLLLTVPIIALMCFAGAR